MSRVIKKTSMNKTTIEQLNKMTDAQFLSHLSSYPYQSQWNSMGAFSHAQYRLALIQGNRYQQTGNIKSLFTH